MEKSKIDKNMKFDISIHPSAMTQDHPEFTRVRASIFYEGFNRNGSYLSADSINRASKSLYNVPLVGEYSPEKNNFLGHGGDIVIKDDEIEFIHTTVPYGVVPMDANLTWETITEKDGTTRDYFIADGALLWTGRYPELKTIIEEGSYGQSAEISVENGSFAIVDGKETFRIDDFNFSALCILGINKDGNSPNDHVEPCFESASISTYQSQDDSFKQNFKYMLETYASKDLGGQENIMTKEKQEVPTNTRTDADFQVLESELEKAQSKLAEFEAQLTAKDSEVEETVELLKAKHAEEFTALKAEYASTVESMKADLQELATKSTEFESVSAEVDELRTFKRETEVEAVRVKFSGKLTEESLEAILSANFEKSVDELEAMIFAEIGKQNFSLIGEEKETKQTEVQFSHVKKDTENGVYGTLIAKHLQ